MLANKCSIGFPLYLTIFKDIEGDTWNITESNYFNFKKNKEHENFFGGIIFEKGDNEKDFKRAEMIVKEGVKGLIVDMREGV